VELLINVQVESLPSLTLTPLAIWMDHSSATGNDH